MFIEKYNFDHQTDYKIVSVAGPDQSPDIIARDCHGNILSIEVTMTEDNPGDIAAALGRSEHKSIDALRAHLKAVQTGKERLVVNCLQENVLMILLSRLEKKLLKRYGRNVALVVRETSLPWDWEMVLPDIHRYLAGKYVPFDQGIWLLSRGKDRLMRIW